MKLISDKIKALKVLKSLKNLRLLKSLTVFSLLLLPILNSCTDKDLDISNPDSPENFDKEGPALTFVMNLGMDFNTRAEDDFDNYIDEDNMMILFFDSSGKFLFEALPESRDIEPSPDHNGQYYVTIYTKTLKDFNGKSFPLSLLKAQLEKDGFKIAVLANWPTPANDNQTDYSLPWGWDNSILNESAVPSKIRTINDLHRLERDSNYGDKNKNDAYTFLKKNGNFDLGAKTNWVTSTLNLDKRAGADEYIRNNWDPSGVTTPSFITDNNYPEDLWQVWNFGGAYDDNALEYTSLWSDESIDQSKGWKDEWITKNGNALKSFLDGIPEDGIKDVGIEKAIEINGLQIVPGDDSQWTDEKDDDYVYKGGGYIKAYHDEANGYHGLVLPKSNMAKITKDVNDKDVFNLKVSSEHAMGYLHLKAPATGTLRIKFGSSIQGSSTKIVIQRNSNYDSNSSGYNSLLPTDYPYSSSSTSTSKGKGRNISITQDPEDIYIYCVSDNAAVIYAIEYICNQYLYDTDRQAVIPDEEQPIPMYGEQDYQKIEDWGSVPVYDLSQTGDHIELIRSVAKVEVYFPSEYAPEKIFMRSMNRTSRAEPMDVFNPSINGWTKNSRRNVHDADHCEWFDIKDYGPLYVSSTTDYKTWLKWFYETWDEITDAPTDPFYHPHVFNPSIDRSDFCEFYYAREVDGMKKYVVYMPDKNIDDPNEVGNISSTPKIAHIEYRYPRHSMYLDDNSCKRIYFTNYATNEIIKTVSSEQFDDYEKNTDFLNELWPVMRNHIYRFYVNSTNQTEDIRVTVNEWGTDRDPKKETW